MASSAKIIGLRRGSLAANNCLRSVLLSAVAWASLAACSAHANPERRVVVELFGEAGCEQCQTVRREVLPDLRATWGERVDIRERDIFETTNYVAAGWRESYLRVAC